MEDDSSELTHGQYSATPLSPHSLPSLLHLNLCHPPCAVPQASTRSSVVIQCVLSRLVDGMDCPVRYLYCVLVCSSCGSCVPLHGRSGRSACAAARPQCVCHCMATVAAVRVPLCVLYICGCVHVLLLISVPQSAAVLSGPPLTPPHISPHSSQHSVK